jgi:hypothetical protein
MYTNFELEKIELKKIEFKNRTWRNKFSREIYIWEAIAEKVNSYKGKERKFWCRVMDLYNDKYC